MLDDLRRETASAYFGCRGAAILNAMVRPSNLALRFTIVPTLVMLLLVGLFFAAVERLVTQQLRAQSSLRVEQRAVLVADRLTAAVSVRIKEVQLLARSAALANPQNPGRGAAMRAELEWLRGPGDAYAWIGVAALDGTLLAGTGHWLEGQSVAGRPVFEEGRSRVFFADFHPPVSLRPWLPANGADQVADIGVPVRDAAGVVVAVVMAHLNAGWLADIGESTVTTTEAERLGMVSYILSGSGQPLREAPPFAVPAPAAAAAPFWVTGSDKHDHLAVVRDVALPAAAGQLHWRVVLTQDAALVATAVQQFDRALLAFSIAAVAACVTFGLLAARLASDPYRHLLGAVQARFKEAGGHAALPYGAYLDALGDELLREKAMGGGAEATLFGRLAADAQQFKRVVDHMPMGVAIASADFRVEYLNDTYSRLLGWTTDQVRGRRNSEFLFGPPDAAAFVEKFESLASLQGGLVARFTVLCADGTQRPVQWQMVPLMDCDDRLYGVIALVQDISGEAMERRRANQLARQLTVFADAAADYALIMLDAAGAFVSWSHGAEVLTGVPSSDALKNDMASLFDKDDRDRGLPARLLQEAQDNYQRDIGHWMVRADGTSFFGEGTLYGLPGAGAEAGFALVISDRTRDREAAQRIAESEARLAAVIAGASDAIISTDLDGKVELFNPAAERLFGVASQAMYGQPLDPLIPGPARELHQRNLGQFAASRVSRRAMGAGKVQGIRADGEVIDLEASISQASVGGRTVLTAILRDITERTRAEKALVDYQHELADLTQQLLAQEKETTQKLAQTLHDDLGQTLAALRLIFDVGRSMARDVNGSAAWFDRIDRLVTDANKQVRRVLTELRPPLIDEQGLIAALDNELDQHGLAQGQVQLVLDAGSLPAEARWPAAVEYAAFMVAREAVNNALRHAAPKRVVVTLAGDMQQLVLQVIDDGSGLTRIEHVVRPGHLGLVGMRERALAIGAALEIKSSPEAGTTVTLRWSHTDTRAG